MSKRLAAIALALGVVVTCAGCSTPKTASGSLEQGKQRVVQLVLAAAHALPAASHFTPPSEVGTQPCRKTVAGFVIGSTGAHRAQVPLIVYTPANQSTARLLRVIGAAWAAAGYQVNSSRLHESQFPQLSATAPGGYDVTATAFTTSAQIDLYAVSQCLTGS